VERRLVVIRLDHVFPVVRSPVWLNLFDRVLQEERRVWCRDNSEVERRLEASRQRPRYHVRREHVDRMYGDSSAAGHKRGVNRQCRPLAQSRFRQTEVGEDSNAVGNRAAGYHFPVHVRCILHTPRLGRGAHQ